jgi:hypothetical protein
MTGFAVCKISCAEIDCFAFLAAHFRVAFLACDCTMLAGQRKARVRVIECCHRLPPFGAMARLASLVSELRPVRSRVTGRAIREIFGRKENGIRGSFWAHLRVTFGAFKRLVLSRKYEFRPRMIKGRSGLPSDR